MNVSLEFGNLYVWYCVVIVFMMHLVVMSSCVNFGDTTLYQGKEATKQIVKRVFDGFRSFAGI